MSPQDSSSITIMTRERHLPAIARLHTENQIDSQEAARIFKGLLEWQWRLCYREGSVRVCGTKPGDSDEVRSALPPRLLHKLQVELGTASFILLGSTSFIKIKLLVIQNSAHTYDAVLFTYFKSPMTHFFKKFLNVPTHTKALPFFKKRKLFFQSCAF